MNPQYVGNTINAALLSTCNCLEQSPRPSHVHLVHTCVGVSDDQTNAGVSYTSRPAPFCVARDTHSSQTCKRSESPASKYNISAHIS